MNKFKTLTMISTAAIVVGMGLSVMATTTKKVTTTSSDVKVDSAQKTTSKVETTQGNKITVDEAKKIALTDAKLNSSDVTFERVELDYENNVAVYEVEFHTNSVEYDYEIDASSGAIREKKQESRKASTQGVINQKPDSQTSISQGANNQVATNGVVGNQTVANQTSNITAAKAKEIAVAHAGLSGQSVTFKKVELDTDDGVILYEVEFYHNGMEYNYEINAVSGKVLDFEVDND